jgi:transcriptional regulator with XRE-family HTH domain
MALGITQAHLAKLAGITQGSIARIETGNAGEVQANTLIALAKALDVTADYLLGLMPEDPPSPKGPRKRVRTSAKVAQG